MKQLYVTQNEGGAVLTKEEFYESVQQLGIVLSDYQKEQFSQYYQLLIEWNKKMNLTAITDESDVYLKHFYDSLTLLKADWDGVNTVCDVGAGAGFPTIPLKIALPQLNLTIVDSLNKRVTFLNELVEQLGLMNVHCYHDRAESFAHRGDMRENFDVVTARAVAPLNVLSELCIPLVKLEGQFIALKAARGEEELNEAKRAINILGATEEEVYKFQLPETGDKRELFVMKKVKSTPNKYPRKPGTPNKKPL